MRLMNVHGSILMERKLTAPETVIDVSDLPSGVYLLNFGLVNRIFLKR